MPIAALGNGVSLAYEVHGDLSNEVILPILGITDNITDWSAGLYTPFVEQGYCVVRHELRDSGLSTKFEVSGVPDLAAAQAQLAKGLLPEAAYTIHDVVEDVLLLMDFLGIQSANVVGYSYGGAVAQLLALHAPERINSLICLQASNYSPALPERTQKVLGAMIAACQPYAAEEEKVDAMKALRMATNGPVHAMNEAEALASAKTSVSRMYYPEGTTRLILSRLAMPPFHEGTRAIKSRSLVIHGTHDPIFPREHGEDLARRIPGAQLRFLDGAGHNHPLSLQPLIADAILAFLAP